MTKVTSKGAIGDAMVEMGENLEGAKYYEEAASVFKNKFTSPIYLMKAAQVYYTEGQYEKALELYERIEKNFPESREYRSIEKYISRTKAMMNS